METSVCLQFVRDAISLLSRLVPLQNLLKQKDGGASQNVQGNAVDLTSISSPAINPVQDILQIKRNPTKTTMDGVFGDMVYDGKWICFTMERKAVAIPVGRYQGCKRDSQHFGMRVVGISVPNRIDIEAHPANQPCQLNGCIATGGSIDNDALDNSKAAFQKMMDLLPESFIVDVC